MSASVPPDLDPSATIANRFFERRSRRTIRALGSPNTPRAVALARKPANENPSDRRRCRCPDSTMAQGAKIERTSKLMKASIHKHFRRYDPSKSPTRFPEDPIIFCGLYSLSGGVIYPKPKSNGGPGVIFQLLCSKCLMISSATSFCWSSVRDRLVPVQRDKPLRRPITIESRRLSCSVHIIYGS